MNGKSGALFLILCLSAAGIFAEEGNKPDIGANTWGVGYDEGLSGKYFILDRIAAYLSLGYDVSGARTGKDQPINNGLLKLGGSYMLFEVPRFRLHAFTELVGFLFQDTLTPKDTTKFLVRYNQYDGAWRAGLQPELFLAGCFSVSYKFGLEYYHYGTTYKLNSDDVTQKAKTNYSEIGIYGYKTGRYMLLHNISLTIYLNNKK